MIHLPSSTYACSRMLQFESDHRGSLFMFATCPIRPSIPIPDKILHIVSTSRRDISRHISRPYDNVCLMAPVVNH
jgi:hypothetical protein